MARPTKCRRVCRIPETVVFSPEGAETKAPVILTVDEFETIRLIDLEGLSQEACGIRLGVGRTTAQKICDTARRKLAEALVSGRPLRIEGGDFRLCSGNAADCRQQDCVRRRIRDEFGMKKGEDLMRIAVTYANGSIFGHFGHTAQFKVYDVAEGRIVNSEVLDTHGSGHGALAGFLAAAGADVLICGGIGPGAQMTLAQAGIRLYGGVSGDADAAVAAFVAGKLDYDPEARCGHHDHHHGDHPCGDHGCGNHDCGHGSCGNH